MENASKALIIAGAILLSILLISLGIMIFGQAKDTIGSSGMSKAEITAYNNQWLKYEGTKVSGSVVRELISEVIASNASDSRNGMTRSVALNGTVKSSSQVVTGQTYTVKLGSPNPEGYIDSIEINEN